MLHLCYFSYLFTLPEDLSGRTLPGIYFPEYSWDFFDKISKIKHVDLEISNM